MDDSQIDLAKHRYKMAIETLNNAKMCYENDFYRDCINRSYYAVFYGIRAVLATEHIDYKRHKDVLAHFNREYVAKDIFPKEVGKRLYRIKDCREASDYDDFFIASAKEAMKQLESVEYILPLIENYLISRNVPLDM